VNKTEVVSGFSPPPKGDGRMIEGRD